MEISWLTAFLDFPATGHDAATAFWSAASGQVVSATRGDDDEFATLLPIGGDDFLRVQRLVDGPARIHLDLHANDLASAGARAEGLGATLAASHDYSTYLSPGGLPFCIVRQPNSVRTTPARWAGHVSLVDQVCLDVPARRFDQEGAFWAALLEREPQPARPDSRVTSLVEADDQPFRIQLQRLDEEDGLVRAHLDLATDNRIEEVNRLLELGATVVRVQAEGTTLRDPAGLEFCVSDRDPVTGVLA